jgi:hypothetical protein
MKQDLLRYAQIIERAATHHLMHHLSYMPSSELKTWWSCLSIARAIERYYKLPVYSLNSLSCRSYDPSRFKRAKADLKAIRLGLKQLGLNPERTQAFKEFPQITRQEVRYAWLMFVAQLAREQAEAQPT